MKEFKIPSLQVCFNLKIVICLINVDIIKKHHYYYMSQQSIMLGNHIIVYFDLVFPPPIDYISL